MSLSACQDEGGPDNRNAVLCYTTCCEVKLVAYTESLLANEVFRAYTSG